MGLRGPKPLDPRRHFWDRVDVQFGGKCWNWKGPLTGGPRGGYGLLHNAIAGRMVAHRFAYELLVGPIPEGMQLDHLCSNRPCVNPAHLEPVTCRENLLRGNTTTARNASRTHCPQGHPYDEENTGWDRGTRRCKACDRDRHRIAAALKRESEMSEGIEA